MSLLAQAPEIHLLIGEQLSFHDLNSLILCNRRLATVLSPLLYRRAVRCDGARAALEFAARTGNVAGAEIFLSTYGADAAVRVDAESGKTALHVAAGFGQPDAARLLLKHGADVDAVAKFGCTPLHLAAMPGSIDVALLKYGVDHALRDRSAAAAVGGGDDRYAQKAAIAELFLEEYGAGVDAKLWFRGGFLTPLLIAAKWGNVDIVRMLVQRGADTGAVVRTRGLLSADTRERMVALVRHAAQRSGVVFIKGAAVKETSSTNSGVAAWVV